MGGQQLLLILLGVLVVAVAITIGIGMFRDNAVRHNRDAIANEMLHFGARAQAYYRTPRSANGGGNSFVGLDDIRLLTATPNGINADYQLNNQGSFISLIGVGKETGIDGINQVKVVLIVEKDSVYFDLNQGN